ncbi:MAG: PAS domain-containing protein, partial [Pseudomonadota bacterium]
MTVARIARGSAPDLHRGSPVARSMQSFIALMGLAGSAQVLAAVLSTQIGVAVAFAINLAIFGAAALLAARRLVEAQKLSPNVARERQALQTCQTNVMIADDDLNIVYMNSTMIEMLRNAQDDIRTELPQFNVDQLIGANIDTFHRSPNHQRSLLKALTSAHRTAISIG